MARTPLARGLQQVAAEVANDDARTLTRRRLLRDAGTAAGAAAGAWALGRPVVARGADVPRVVVVGAGLAHVDRLPGAVETGERAANEVLSDLRLALSP